MTPAKNTKPEPIPLPSLPENWVVEGVSEHGPRAVYYSITYRQVDSFFRYASILITVVGLPFILYQANRTEHFALKGQVVTGTISDNMSKGGAKYRLAYAYRYDDQVYQGETYGDKKEYARRRLGDSVPITLLPENPEVHRYGRITMDDVRNEQLKGSAWIILTSAIPGAIWLYAIKGRQKRTTIAREWPALPAQVTHVKKEDLSQGRGRWTINYRLRRPDGTIEEHTYSDVEVTDLGVKPGDMVAVFVNPKWSADLEPHWKLHGFKFAPEPGTYPIK